MLKARETQGLLKWCGCVFCEASETIRIACGYAVVELFDELAIDVRARRSRTWISVPKAIRSDWKK